MKFKIKTLRFRSGEEITIRQTEDGADVCPVCGVIRQGGDPPYAESQALVNGQRVGSVGVGGSFDICGICHTQYGYSEFPDVHEPQSVNWKWQQLRCEWLRSVEITEEVREQLRNLGLNPDEEIRRCNNSPDTNSNKGL